jgi:hypothetical protein
MDTASMQRFQEEFLAAGRPAVLITFLTIILPTTAEKDETEPPKVGVTTDKGEGDEPADSDEPVDEAPSTGDESGE